MGESEKMKLKGRLMTVLEKDFNPVATISIEPRELLEQTTHKEINELLKLINLPQPQPEPKKEIEELPIMKSFEDICGQAIYSHQLKLVLKLNEVIVRLNSMEGR